VIHVPNDSSPRSHACANSFYLLRKLFGFDSHRMKGKERQIVTSTFLTVTFCMPFTKHADIYKSIIFKDLLNRVLPNVTLESHIDPFPSFNFLCISFSFHSCRSHLLNLKI